MVRLLRVLLFASLLLVLAASGVARRADFVMAQGNDVATITGRVTSDLDGSGLASVNIILIDPNTPDVETVVASTDGLGYFTATQAISNTWIIRLGPTADGVEPFHLPEYYDDTYDLDSATLVTAEVGTVTPSINASLAGRGQISGRVTADEDGSPIASVRVSTFDPDDTSETATAYTDSSGAYTLTLYFAGSHRLRFDPLDQSGYALEYYNDKYSLSEAQVVTVPEGRDLRLNVSLGTGGMITGMVHSSWLNKPVNTPTVYALNAAGEQIQVGGRYVDDPSTFDPVDPPGYYAIYNLPAGSYQLRFEASNHQPFKYTTPVQVEQGETVTNINATVQLLARVNSLATSATAPGTILLAFQHDPVPILTTNDGVSWQLIPNPTWLADAEHFAYPDQSSQVNVSVGVAPRGAPGEGTRLLVNVGELSGYQEVLRPGLYRSGDNGISWAEATVDPVLGHDSCGGYFFNTPVTTLRAPDHLYMISGCSFDFLSRLLVSDNSGVTWRDVTTRNARTLVLLETAKIVASPLVDGLLYVHAGDAEWYRSANDGLDWEEVTYPVESLALDAENAAVLYGWTTRFGPTFTRDGKRSTDGGATWENWGQNPCPFSFNTEPPQLLAHPTAGQVLFVRCDNDLTDGLYRSTDGGDSWQKIANANGQLLAADLGVPGRILWAKDDGLWASTNNGDTWQPIMQNYRVISTLLHLPTISGAP